MLKRSSKTEKGSRVGGAPRLLVVDDNPDVACLLSKLFRRAGYQVAEVGDHQVAMVTLINEPEPITAIVVSYSNAGAGACLKMLDAVRNNPDPRISTMRVILIIDSPRQQMFSWQSGADDILLRPYHATQMLQAVKFAIERNDAERSAYRRQRIEGIKTATIRGVDVPVDPALVRSAANFM